MKISIVTACYNSKNTIEDTLRCIKNQTHPDIEHIVVDGGSTDGTVDILKRYQDDIDCLIIEPDKGHYDGMNKGLRQATGDIIGLLNSDDFYYNNDVLKLVAQTLEDPNVDACYGDLLYVEKENTDKVLRYWQSSDYQHDLFGKGWMPPHPTFFFKKHVHDNFGAYFNLKYTLAADVDVLMRLLYTHKIRTKYIPQVMTKMRVGGQTNQSFKNMFKQNRQVLELFKDNNYDASMPKFMCQKLINRLGQFAKRKQYAE